MIYIYIKRKEEWKPVTYKTIKPNKYMVSNHGRVFSLYYNKILKPSKKISPTNGRTYLSLSLAKSENVNKNRNYVDILIHRLVAFEFVDNPNELEFDFVHHKDNDSLNNYYENLEWINNKLNQLDARDNGYLNPRKGIHHPLSIYSVGFIDELCVLIYEYNMSNLDIISYIYDKYQNNHYEYIDINNSKLRTLLNHLRRGDRHKDIVTKYTKRFNDYPIGGEIPH